MSCLSTEMLFDKILDNVLLLLIFVSMGAIGWAAWYSAAVRPSIEDCDRLGDGYGAIYSKYDRQEDSCTLIFKDETRKVIVLGNEVDRTN